MKLLSRLLILLLLVASAVRAERIEFVWPTPNKAWERGRPIDDFIQPTAAGDPESGTFGCVRSHGAQFHEGLDIRPVSRDRSGEPADPVFAAMRGVVRYVSHSPGGSNYGRYIVIEHPDLRPAVYTLYAHLARIEPGVRPGVSVAAGQTIGLMGRSSSGQAIPRERGHLHFEIGLRVTDSFDSWYLTKRFGSRNEHGNFNGMNLMGLDPLEFLRLWRLRQVDDFQQFLDRQVVAVRVRVVTTRVPDFIQRYPSLLRRPMPAGLVGGWEIECNWTGIPFAWAPLTPGQVMGLRPGTVQVLEASDAVVRGHRCKHLVRSGRGGYEPGSDLDEMIEQVFGFR
jgi:peptidoglycan LD-endopeptidase LytH